MTAIISEKSSSCPPHYPTACCELLHASVASYVTAALQLNMNYLFSFWHKAWKWYTERLHNEFSAASGALILFLLVLLGLTYHVFEKRGYFVNPEAFRPVVAAMGTLYALGAIAAVVGVASERRFLVNAQITLVTSLMVFTDIIAVSIILIMAIGNRNEFTNSIPSHFVDERKFYDAFGPFWMYLGAFCLHITVAVNMCCLQPYNSFIGFLDEKAKQRLSAVHEHPKQKVEDAPSE